jgi:hypothetical protein
MESLEGKDRPHLPELTFYFKYVNKIKEKVAM